MTEPMQFPPPEPMSLARKAVSAAVHTAIVRRIFDASWTELYPGWELPDWPQLTQPPRIDREAMRDPYRRYLKDWLSDTALKDAVRRRFRPLADDPLIRQILEEADLKIAITRWVPPISPKPWARAIAETAQTEVRDDQ
ncbi:hypothetical protein [Dietzia cercidiphylli]|uniref:Uncharacterized protein n=1 Tax=Dietzia cercidiphylli TaxID=498199 RepID=A0ABP4VCP6_9ACTN|nr:hypothetical protein [Dietzia cercidiphylli]MBB1046445.1 hypothetical protein [Dietzia cercidiphylli]